MTAAWAPLGEALASDAGAPLLRCGARTIAHAGALARIERTALRLAGLGVAPGEIVAVLPAPTAGCVLALLALWHAGLPSLLVSAREPAAARAALLRRAGCRLLLAPRATADEGVASLPFRALLARAGLGAARLPDRPPRTLPGAATVLATSGSTGSPKLVVHGLRAHVASALGAREHLRLGRGDRWLLSLPLHHAGGLGIVCRAVLAGAEVALPPRRAALPAACAAVRPTHVSVVATQLARMLADGAARAALRDAKAVLAGGGPLPLALRRAALAEGVPLQVSYGATETASLLTAERDPVRLLRAGSAGAPLPRRALRIAADGEILAGGETLLDGYLTERGLDPPRRRDGLLATGDLGRLDADGCLIVGGRADEMFISGGENVDPHEVEQALLETGAVAEAVVVPAADPEWGMRPVAFVRAHEGATLHAAHLDRALAARLPRFKRPDRYFALPPARGLKPDRRWLRQLAADARLEPL